MSNDIQDKVFQILVVKEDENFSEGIHTKLITQPKNKFPQNIRDRLPSKGAIIKEDFLPITNIEETQQNLADRYSVSILLKARKLSQLIAKSWLPKESLENKITRKLLLTGNLEPDEFETNLSQELKDTLNLPPTENSSFAPTENSLLHLHHIATTLRSRGDSDIPPSSDPRLDRTHLILPDGLNWELIRVALLVSGQVYLEQDNTYTPVSEPISSTYDVCVYIAFQVVSWNAYAASRIEFSQSGKNARPPYFKADIPYPPILQGESTDLRPEDISSWAYAADESGESPWPFYPDKKDGRYVSNLVKNIVPPYPYIPLSCF